jgi:ATPase family associated with various cellular activities (AAA)
MKIQKYMNLPLFLLSRKQQDQDAFQDLLLARIIAVAVAAAAKAKAAGKVARLKQEKPKHPSNTRHRMPQPAWLIYGPPGCGKTTWILSQVKQEKKKLYHWNARTDRTLREGRETLHRQVRSQEPLFVWIEGADDLTPEAQAFLRRILETVSTSVQCILECRDPQRITPAIQSRCEWKQCSFKQSFRKEKQKQIIGTSANVAVPENSSCLESFHAAVQPIDCLKEYLKHPTLWEEAILSLKAVGAGSSPWAHLYHLKALCVQ